MAELAGNLLRHGPIGAISRRIWPPNAPTPLGDISIPLETLSVRKFTTGVLYTRDNGLIRTVGPVIPMKENLYDLLKSDIDKCSFGVIGRFKINADLGLEKSFIHRVTSGDRVAYLAFSVILQPKTMFTAYETATPFTGSVYSSTIGYIYVTRVGEGENAVEYIKFKRTMRMDTELHMNENHPTRRQPRFEELKFHLTKYTYPYLHDCLRKTLQKALEPFAKKREAAEEFAMNMRLPSNVAKLVGNLKYGKRTRNARVPLNKLIEGKQRNFNPPQKSMVSEWEKENAAAAAAKRARLPAANGNGNRSGGGKTRKRRHS